MVVGWGRAVLEPGKNKSPNTVMESLDLREEECPWPWGCQGAATVCPLPPSVQGSESASGFQGPWAGVPALHLPGCVTLGKRLHLSALSPGVQWGAFVQTANMAHEGLAGSSVLRGADTAGCMHGALQPSLANPEHVPAPFPGGKTEAPEVRPHV